MRNRRVAHRDQVARSRVLLTDVFQFKWTKNRLSGKVISIDAPLLSVVREGDCSDMCSGSQ